VKTTECPKCRKKDEITIKIGRCYSEEDGQLEKFVLECNNCAFVTHRMGFAYEISSYIMEKVFAKK